MKDTRLSKAFLLVLVIAISATFIAMIRGFLMAIFLAAVISGLAQPLFRRLVDLLRGRRGLAALITLILLVVVIAAPLLAVTGIVAGEALRVGEMVRPWIERQLAQPDHLARMAQDLPGFDRLAPYRQEILTKAGELVNTASNFMVDILSAATRGTVALLFQVFILLYTLFFFLKDGNRLLLRILYYLPLDAADEQRMLEKFTSVTRATLKGTLLVGIAQGGTAGIAFWVVGIQGPVFWATLMTVLSIIPGIGTALIWAPAAFILLVTGHFWKGVGLGLFCLVVVNSIDNLLRPRLVGHDTKMHDLLILFGTLGGILLFGVLGFIVGPIVAALFVTVWDIYGAAFRDMLPKVRGSAFIEDEDEASPDRPHS